jgi:hypothetical protein
MRTEKPSGTLSLCPQLYHFLFLQFSFLVPSSTEIYRTLRSASESVCRPQFQESRREVIGCTVATHPCCSNWPRPGAGVVKASTLLHRPLGILFFFF